MKKEIEQKIVNLREKGIGYKKIAKMLNLTYGNVSDVLIKNGIISHIIMPNEETVNDIISMYCNKMLSLKKIAKHFNTTSDRISRILKAKHVELTPSAYHRKYKSNIDHDYFEKIDTERKAYWLGFLYADGYNSEKTASIEITLKHEDKYLLDELNSDIKSIYKVKDRYVPLNGKIFHENRLILYSKKISTDLANKGCYQNKSLTLKFPHENIVPQNLIHHFMRGYFDGDGCITGPKFSIDGTKNFVDDYVRELRNNTDISKAGYYQNDGKALCWGHSSMKDIKKIYDFLYKDSTIFMKRKHKRFLDIIKQLPLFSRN